MMKTDWVGFQSKIKHILLQDNILIKNTIKMNNLWKLK